MQPEHSMFPIKTIKGQYSLMRFEQARLEVYYMALENKKKGMEL